MKGIKKLYRYFSNYLVTHFNRVQYIMFVASVAGLASGLMAVLLKTLVHYLQHWIEDIPLSKFAYLLFPAIGLVITVFIIRYFFGGQIERGIVMVLKAIARKSLNILTCM
jgi:chloride channel protein, CIC family